MVLEDLKNLSRQNKVLFNFVHDYLSLEGFNSRFANVSSQDILQNFESKKEKDHKVGSKHIKKIHLREVFSGRPTQAF